MTDAEETAYAHGQRALWVRLLQQGMRELGYATASPGPWLLEREGVIALLRQLCATYGDNDWDETLWLPDVLEKHLWDQLQARAPAGDD